MKTLQQFIDANGLTMTVTQVKARPDGGLTNMARHFACLIINGQCDRFVVYFSQGSAHKDTPTLPEVLSCLADESQIVWTTDTFEGWAKEYGYNPDSRKAEAVYNISKAQATEFCKFLGVNAYNELLFETERL